MADTLERQAETIIGKVLELPEAERSLAAARACGGDAELLRRVMSLLSAASQARGFMDVTADAASPGLALFAEVGEKPGDLIGPYKLLEKIGEGGFGVVFKAEQQRPVRRQVAVKVIKLGMDTREVVARFEAERQALALMDHPNIARVLDAGATTTGRPFFVMELVRGSPVTEYADKHKLGTRERVALAVQICRAVQHAHSKGVIHRDLKPNNVLVTVTDDKPVPKVIDFGIAKATRSRLTERTLYTAHRQLIGTPQYMSPEQADSDGSDIDTRSDIYSLGVLLYELLIGTTPIDASELRSAAYEAMRKMIRETDLPTPATRLDTLAAATRASIASARSTDVKRLSDSVKGELDWIVMKALEKDRSRRYDTAAAFADDLNRYLAGEAVLAGPVSGAYRLKKTLKRYKSAVAVGAGFAACLLLGMAGTTYGLVREAGQRRIADQRRHEAEQQRLEANQQRAEADVRRIEADQQRVEAQRQKEEAILEQKRAVAIGEFLVNDVLAGASPEATKDRSLSDTLVKALIEPAMARVEDRFKSDPAVRSAVQGVLAETLMKLGRADLAVVQAERAYKAIREALGDKHPDTAHAFNTYLEARIESGQAAGAVEPARQLLASDQALFGDDSELSIIAEGTYGKALLETQQWELAIAAAGDAADRSRRVFGSDDQRTIAASNNYAAALASAGHLANAADLFNAVWAHAKQLHGDDDYQTIQAADNYVETLVQQGRMDLAEPIAKAQWDRDRRIFGMEDRSTIRAGENYAEIFMARNRPDLALPISEPVYHAALKVYPDRSKLPREVVHTYAFCLRRLRKTADAIPVYELNNQLTQLQHPEDQAEIIAGVLSYAQVLAEDRRYTAAEPLAAEMWQHALKTPQFANDPQLMSAALSFYAAMLDRTGKKTELDQLSADVQADTRLRPLLPVIAAATRHRQPTTATTR